MFEFTQPRRLVSKKKILKFWENLSSKFGDRPQKLFNGTPHHISIFQTSILWSTHVRNWFDYGEGKLVFERFENSRKTSSNHPKHQHIKTRFRENVSK